MILLNPGTSTSRIMACNQFDACASIGVSCYSLIITCLAFPPGLHQVIDLLGRTSDRKQTLLFSATMPKTLADFAQAGLQSPQLVRLDTETRISPELKLAFFTVR